MESLNPSALISVPLTCQSTFTLLRQNLTSFRVAVYANGKDNFTNLAVVGNGNLPGNEYGTYMYSLYAAQRDWRNVAPQIIDYDNDESREPSASWLEQLSTASQPVKQLFKSWICSDSSGYWRFPKYLYKDFCFTSNGDWEYGPKRPRSRYQHLLTEARMNRLRSILPKWFRHAQSTKKTRSKLILYIVECLERIKELTLRDHGIRITSAIISLPHWACNEYDDIFDEACLLAGIEVLEQPHDRSIMATKPLAVDVGPVLVLDHGFYQLGIHRSTWNEHDKQYHQRSSIDHTEFGTIFLLRRLANRVIWGSNLNATEDYRGWARTLVHPLVLKEVSDARLQINHRPDWSKDIKFENRTVGVNLADSTGFLTVLNMTGEDVEKVEQQYVKEISTKILRSITKHEELFEYAKSE